VADEILSEIDLDGNRSISDREEQSYAHNLLRQLVVDVDGVPRGVALVDSVFPSVDLMLRGEGTIRLRVAASFPRLADGRHHLRYSNANRPDIGVYLANALVPTSDRVAVTAQRRDVDQRDLAVDYVLFTGSAARTVGDVALGIAGLGIWIALLRWCLVTARKTSQRC
jgi:hypothetical protein